MASRRDRVAAAIYAKGTPTLINRAEVTVNGRPLRACWGRAQANRVQQFDQDLISNRPLYEVALPADVFFEPISLKIGSELTWVATGWRGDIRSLDPVDLSGEIVGVTAIVVIMSEV